MEHTEIIIRDNGTLTERIIRERDLSAEADVLEAMTADVTRTIRNAMPIPGWGLAANVGLSDTIWSVPIDRIPLKARFRVTNGVLVPMFASLTDLEMPMVWQAPKDVRLVFVVRTEVSEGCVVVGGNWLFACNKDNNGFRLPLPNLHDECTLCTGQFESSYASAQAGVSASLEPCWPGSRRVRPTTPTSRANGSSNAGRRCAVKMSHRCANRLRRSWARCCSRIIGSPGCST